MVKVCDYLVDTLIKYNVTDVFGIPGGVILDFLYALDGKNHKIKPRLSLHEQAATFAASGYAQVNNKLGVVYVTRGPGVTNTLTAVADAYYDSIPLLIITAHTFQGKRSNRRIDVNQEIDNEKLFSSITKDYIKISTLNNIQEIIEKGIKSSLEGRKGPVVLDFYTPLLNSKITIHDHLIKHEKSSLLDYGFQNDLKNILKNARRPILLIGDGIHQSQAEDKLIKFINRTRIPFISSRYSQDVFPNSDYYFGYLGSHGLRYTNFILEKSDLIIVLGNSLSFPENSITFNKILSNKKLIRFDIDLDECSRKIRNVTNYQYSLTDLFDYLFEINHLFRYKDNWLTICQTLKKQLFDYDVNDAVKKISQLLEYITNEFTIVSDVGNNEFWLCRAYAFSKSHHRVLFSKSFGSMGSSIPKSIGIYYKTRKPVVSFNGDQGIQMNIQELQYIGKYKLPIVIVVVNNMSSGMIKSRQIKSFDSNFLHTTTESGYVVSDFRKVALSYGIEYLDFDKANNINKILSDVRKPYFIELQVDPNIDLTPNILRGDDCQNMEPYLNNNLYEKLNKL